MATISDSSDAHAMRRMHDFRGWVRTIDAAWVPVAVGVALILVATWFGFAG